MKYDYENCIEYAEEKGREEGEAKGVAEKARSVAVNMLGKGFSANIIAECTGLSVEEVNAMKTN